MDRDTAYRHVGQKVDWRNDPVVRALRRETDELLRAMEADRLAITRRTDAIIAKWEAEREESRALRRELLERAGLPPPAQAA